MTKSTPTSNNYTLINSEAELTHFAQANKGIKWLGFDTEFMGENHKIPKLCTIQLSTENGIYLVDMLRFKRIDPLLELFTDPDITIITHSGINDFSLMYDLYGLVPTNVFDTQIAAGFALGSYPLSFQNLVRMLCNVNLKKSSTLTDWSRRPLTEKQIKYALDDVIYLQDMYTTLVKKLKKNKRTIWAEEEFQHMLDKAKETNTWESDFYKFRQVYRMSSQDKLILLRLLQWRDEQSTLKNVNPNSILNYKWIGDVLKELRKGNKTPKENRLLNRGKPLKYWPTWVEMMASPMTKAEEAIIDSVEAPYRPDPDDWRRDLFRLLIKQRCYDAKIPIQLCTEGMSSSSTISGYDDAMYKGWRKEVIGDELVSWIESDIPLEIIFEDDQCVIKRLS